MKEWGIFGVMVATECLEVGLNTLSKASMGRGMSDFVFVVYSNAFALLLLFPLAFFVHRVRSSSYPPLSFSVVSRIFLLGLISSCLQILMYFGIGYSSPTLASALVDLTPAFTFILATFTRMEKLDLRVGSSQAKGIGTIVSISGAFVVTFYEGPPIIFSKLLSTITLQSPGYSNWITGGFLLATSSFLLAVLYIVQTGIIRDYPSELNVTVICCFFVTIQSAIVGLVAERDPNAWKLSLDMELVTIIYSAFIVVSFRSLVYTWALRKKGPVYVTMFKPLEIVIAVAMGVTFLGDTLHVGSAIGAVIIALGFYSVVWGKAKEEKTVELDDEKCSSSSPDEVHLLHN